MMELHNYLNEKKAELERYNVELESLAKVEAEQKVLISKLSSSEWYTMRLNFILGEIIIQNEAKR